MCMCSTGRDMISYINVCQGQNEIFKRVASSPRNQYWHNILYIVRSIIIIAQLPCLFFYSEGNIAVHSKPSGS